MADNISKLALSRLLVSLVLLYLLLCDTPLHSDDKMEVAEQPAAPAIGRLLRIPLPITGNIDHRAIQRIRSVVDDLKATTDNNSRTPVLILQLDPGQTEFGSGSEFEDSLKLARFLVSSKLNGIKTVAYVPRSIKGHAVLVAIACDQIIMDNEAKIGDAGADHNEDQPVDQTILSGYRQIAESRHTVAVEIAEAMLDSKRRLLRVETDKGPQLVFAGDLPALKENFTVNDQKTQVIFTGGEPANLSGRDARELGVASHLASSNPELARRLGLSRIESDPFVEGDLRARRILLMDYVDARFAETRMRMIEDAIRSDRVNLLCLWIDCEGGDVDATTQLAGYIAGLDSEEVLSIAYIPNKASGAAALIALACDDIVMHPDAVLGGGIEQLEDGEMDDILAVVTDEIVPRKARSYALAAAMFKEDMTVYRFQNRKNGLIQYFSNAEFEKLDDKDQWQRGEQVTEDDVALLVDGRKAEQLDIASLVIDNFEALKAEYGLEHDPAFVEPGWVDSLVRALSSPEFGAILIMIGMAGMYAEVQLPGMGIGGFIAAVAFSLFFWANFMNHTANELEIVLFLVGICCLILEVFVFPGFGIFGLGGGAMILVSLILASQTFVLPKSAGDVQQLRDSLLVVGGAIIGLVGFAFVMRRYLPETPFLNRLMLPELASENQEQYRRESIIDYQG
ncbi:MAG: hypothetical protein N2C12_08825, partial [Planctomycetales bacterium]